MNLKNWNKNHTLGLLVGTLTPLIVIPIVLLILAWAQNFYLEQLWYKFKNNSGTMSKMLTLAILGNLGIFYLFLNKEKYDFAKGIILGSICYIPFIVYFVFFA